jgi:tRNA-2-methylthio-N6-dimethylallyladenosine synthase
MPDQVPADVVGERYARLVALVEDIAWGENKKYDGAMVDVLVAEGEGRKDTATKRMSGRALDNRLVHIGACDARPGDVVTARVTYAAPHHLVADDVQSVRRTRGGDAWQARHAAPPATGPVSNAVPLGMPSFAPAG